MTEDNENSILKLQEKLNFAENEIKQKDKKLEDLYNELNELINFSEKQKSELNIFQKKSENLESIINSLKDSTVEGTIIKKGKKSNIDLERPEYSLLKPICNNKIQKQISSKSVEMDEVKAEIVKQGLKSKSYKQGVLNNNHHNDINDNDNNSDYIRLGIENLNQETQNLLNTLVQEVDDLKKEKLEFQEKALERITEKEIEIISLKELMKQHKATFQKEMNEIVIKASEGRLSTFESICPTAKEEEISINSDQPVELLEKINILEHQNSNIKLESENKILDLMKEKEAILKENSIQESEYKARISNLENEIAVLKIEVSRMEMEKLQAQRELSCDSETKQIFYNTMDDYLNKIKNLEDQRDKAEVKYSNKISALSKINEELETSDKQLKQQLEKSKSEFVLFKVNTSKKVQENEEKYRKDIDLKDKQIKALNEKIECLNKKFKTMKSENTKFAKLNDIHKLTFTDTQETLNNIIENNNKVIKIWEDKYYELERKFEIEKNDLIENNAKIHKKLQQQKSIKQVNSSNHLKSNHEEKEERTGTLEDALNEDENHNNNFLDQDDEDFLTTAKMRIVTLESQVTVLNNNILDLKFNIDKLVKDKELLLRENSKLRENINKTSRPRKDQIKFVDGESSLKNQKTPRKHLETSLLKKQFRIDGFFDCSFEKQLQKTAELSRIRENIFINNDELDIHKEENNEQNLNNIKNLTYYEEELRKAEQSAINARIQFAKYVFEKEEEIIKLKQLNKRFMDKLGLTFS